MWHDSLASSLRNADESPPGFVERHDGKRDERRFNVYRNNIMVSLLGNLADGFPVTETLVGDEFFRAMAREYITLSPPHSPVMVFYGDDFGDFIDGFEPAASVPYLGDIARLEYLERLSLHAADESFFDKTSLSANASDKLLSAQFRFHPSFQVFSSSYPIFDIMMRHRGEDSREISAEGQNIALCRRDNKIMLYPLDLHGLRFLTQISKGFTITEAVSVLPENMLSSLSSLISLAIDFTSEISFSTMALSDQKT